MTEYRQDQIEQAAKRYVKDIVTPLPASLMTAFIKGAEYADQNPINYDGKAMLHVLNKGHEQGWKDAFAKASIFVYQLATAFPDTSYIDVDKIRDNFKKYMEEQR